MVRYAAAYVATSVVFLGIDYIWLTRAMTFYKLELGGLLAEKPNLAIAGGFYALYVAGIIALAVVPADRNGSWITALILGGVLGLIAYGTYDLTNLATLKSWSTRVAVVDIVWGTFLTAISSVAGYLAISLLSRSE